MTETNSMNLINTRAKTAKKETGDDAAVIAHARMIPMIEEEEVEN
jgi:hypothetical protein